MRYIISCNKTSVSWDIIGHDDVMKEMLRNVVQGEF